MKLKKRLFIEFGNYIMSKHNKEIDYFEILGFTEEEKLQYKNAINSSAAKHITNETKKDYVKRIRQALAKFVPVLKDMIKNEKE